MSSLYAGNGPMGATGSNMLKNKAPSGYKTGQLQKYGPQEMGLYNQLAGMAAPESYLSRLAGGDEEMFNQIEAPAHRLFQEKQGQLASRFSGMGLGGRNSSGFQNAANQQTSDFAQSLAANRQQLQRQATMDLRDLIDQLLGRNNPKENYLVPKREKKSSGWGALGGATLGGVGGFFAGGGNPFTAMQGAQLGYNVGSQF